MLFVQILMDRGVVSVFMDTMDTAHKVHVKVSYDISDDHSTVESDQSVARECV